MGIYLWRFLWGYPWEKALQIIIFVRSPSNYDPSKRIISLQILQMWMICLLFCLNKNHPMWIISLHIPFQRGTNIPSSTIWWTDTPNQPPVTSLLPGFWGGAPGPAPRPRQRRSTPNVGGGATAETGTPWRDHGHCTQQRAGECLRSDATRRRRITDVTDEALPTRSVCPDTPCNVRYIYLQNWAMFEVNVG